MVTIQESGNKAALCAMKVGEEKDLVEKLVRRQPFYAKLFPFLRGGRSISAEIEAFSMCPFELKMSERKGS